MKIVKQVKFKWVWDESEATKLFYKVFGTNCSFHVEYSTTEKVQFLFFKSFLLVLKKFSFWKEDKALGYIFPELPRS